MDIGAWIERTYCLRNALPISDELKQELVRLIVLNTVLANMRLVHQENYSLDVLESVVDDEEHFRKLTDSIRNEFRKACAMARSEMRFKTTMNEFMKYWPTIENLPQEYENRDGDGNQENLPVQQNTTEDPGENSPSA